MNEKVLSEEQLAAIRLRVEHPFESSSYVELPVTWTRLDDTMALLGHIDAMTKPTTLPQEGPKT